MIAVADKMVKSPLIALESICFAYPRGTVVLDRLDFQLHPGERIGLVAPNGSGKTTVFHVIMGLLKPTDGTVRLFGQPMADEKDFAAFRHRIGLLFQDPDDQLFCPTVLDDVAFGPLNLGRSKEEAAALSRRVLSFLGLEGFEDRVTFKLSGGEKRLVSLAAVLALEPEVLLLDEPTAGLDQKTKARLVQVLNALNLPGVVISHEYDFLEATTNRIYSMEAGRILLDEEIHLHRHEHAHRLGRRPHAHA
jgi:cobalt/nickel transport system ATP-binding protein